jgi:RHS repeat-associated protein
MAVALSLSTPQANLAHASTAGRIASHSVARLPAPATRPMTLAQRRGQVRRDMAVPRDTRIPIAKGTPVRPTAAQLRTAEAKIRASASKPLAKHSGSQLADSGPLRHAGNAALSTSQTPSGDVPLLWVTGPGGPVSWVEDTTIVSNPAGDPPFDFGNGAVFVGEDLTATADVFNIYDDCSGIPGPDDCPNVYYNVAVTWSVQCNGLDTDYNLNQVVSAPDEDTWANSPPGQVPGILVPLTFQLTAKMCGSQSQYQAPPNFFVTATAYIAGTTQGGPTVTEATELEAVPSSQLQGCPCGPDSSGQPQLDEFRGDAVNTATGQYADSFTDATVKGPGYPLTVTRNYSSGAAASGPLGPGWTMPWFASLSVQANGDVVFNSENGSQYYYTSNGDGTFDAPTGARSVLAQTASGGYTLTTPTQDVLAFNSSGQMTSEEDPTGRGLTFTYSGSQLTSVVDAAGQTVTLSYTGALLTKVTLPNGRVIDYSYSSGRLTSATTPGGTSGLTTSYTYTSAGLLASITDPNGNHAIRNTYNSSGQVVSSEDGTGATTAFSYTTVDGLNETDTTDPNGGIWTDAYAGNVLVASYDPLGNETSYVHDYLLDIVQATDPLGNSAVSAYDGNGNMLSYTGPLGDEQQWTYNADNDVTSWTSADGDTTRYSYNAKGEVNSVTSPSGGKTTYSYNGAGNLVSSVDPRGNVSGANAASFTTTYGYNSAGQLTSATSPTGAKSSYAYDAEGYLSQVTDPLGQVTKYGYDADERLVTVTAPDGGVTKYAYDGAGNLVSLTDPDNNTWTYSYDADNRLIKGVNPLSESTAYTYDGDGNQVTSTAANGVVTTATYDADNRPVKVTYSDGTHTVSYAYDADGDTVSVSDATGTRTLAYDADGDLISVTGPGSGSFKYEYDAAGNVTSRSYPDGTKSTYSYNDDGQLASLINGSAATTYSYDQAGNLTSSAMPGGVSDSRSYNGSGELTSITDKAGSTTLDSYALTLNADGEPSQVSLTQDGKALPTWYYGYDANGRLASACATSGASSSCSTASGGGETAWTYDKAGNRLTQVTGGATTSYTYNAAEELTKAVTGSTTVSYGYNADGAQTTAGSNTYAYNGAGEVSQAVTSAGTYTYSYDAGGDLSAVSKAGVVQQTAIWDINNPVPLAAEQVGSSGATTADYLYGPGDTLASMSTSAGTYAAVTDWLGSVTGLVNSSGSQVASTTYGPYGTATTTGTPTSSVGYAGSYTLADSGGLDDMHARDYSPATAGFTSVDPMLSVTDQPYAYASDDPVYYTDPTGRIFGIDNVIAGLIGAIAGGGAAILNDLAYGKKIKWSDVAIAAATGFAYGAAADECGICAGAASAAVNNALTQLNDNGWSLNNFSFNELEAETATGALMGSFDEYMGSGGGEHVADTSSETIKAGLWTLGPDLAEGAIDPASVLLNPAGALCALIDQAGDGGTFDAAGAGG